MGKEAVTRLIALIGSLLAYFGINIPQTWEDWAVGAIMLAIMAYGFWKNNNFTDEAKQAQKYLNKLKQ